MHEPRIPEIGEFVRGAGTLVRLAAPQPTPTPPTEYVFERVGARWEVRHKGDVLTKGSSFWDFGGLESSIDAAIDDAREYATLKGITAASELEVVVVKETSCYRARASRDASVYDSRFIHFTSTANCKWDVPEDVEVDVWSTRSAAAEEPV